MKIQMPSKRELRAKWANAGKDVVILHMLPRGKLSPNISPYPVKLETFLRMAEIKFETDFDMPMSSKGKSPWITFNGEDIADSQFSIERILKDLPEANLDAHLSAEEKAVARAFRSLCEDNLYFCVLSMRWIHGDPNELFEYDIYGLVKT